MQGLESSVVLKRQTFSPSPSCKISNKWSNGLNERSTFGETRELCDIDFAMATLTFSRPT